MSQTTQVPTVTLNDGTQIPQLGLGVFQVPPQDTTENVLRALEIGYRHLDTAAAYGNEAQVGAAIKASGIPREELWVTTKVFNDHHGYDQATTSIRESLGRLELGHLDLILIHWPVPSQDRYVETWKALIDAREAGLVRSAGVSNFNADHLRRIIEETGETPSVNQIELHPYFNQTGLRREHAERGIVTEAWSPIAQGKVLDDPTLTAIAAAHGRSTAQVTLRWHLQHGIVVFPKSVTESRLRENFDVFGFTLTDDEMASIDGLDRGMRTGPDPETFNRA